MRFSSLLLLGAAAVVSAAGWDDEDATSEPTYFNDIRVPALIELTPETFTEAVESTKHMFIKHYSPYCPHCIEFAPTFQTLYEFYSTSKVEGSDESFAKFYDFKFATVNCIAYYDMCQEHKVKSYPSSMLYVDGQLADVVKGVRSMEVLSARIEKELEATKPGTRPKTLLLPKPGDKKAPDTKSAAADAADAAVVSGLSAAGLVSPATALAATPVATTPASPTPTAAKIKAPPKPALLEAKKWGAMNVAGESVMLNHANFEERVTKSTEPWFIKFYAPWCHHCQALAPKWVQMARAMKGKLNIGEVNCDKEKSLCKSLKVQAYPSILFFDGAERVEYRGLRGLGDFIEYAETGLELMTGVPDVDAAAFKELEAKEDVIFVYFYDHATTSEDFKAVQKLPLHLLGRGKIVTTSDPVLFDRFKITTWPRLLSSREGRPTYYNPMTPREMRDVPLLLEWVKTAWLPLVPELTAATAREIMEGKLVVLAVLDRAQTDSFASSRREIKTAANDWMDRQIQEFQLERQKLRDAKQMRIEEAEDRDDQRGVRNAKNIRIDMTDSMPREVTFAWVDGVFWQRWIKTTYGVDVRDGERVIINDEDNRRYWDTTASGTTIPVSRTRITETLEKVVYSPGSIPHKLTVSLFAEFFYSARAALVNHWILALFGLFAGMYMLVQYIRRQARLGAHGNAFHGEDGGMPGFVKRVDGVLGSNGDKDD